MCAGAVVTRLAMTCAVIGSKAAQCKKYYFIVPPRHRSDCSTLSPVEPAPLGVTSTHVRIFSSLRKGYLCATHTSLLLSEKDFDDDHEVVSMRTTTMKNKQCYVARKIIIKLRIPKVLNKTQVKPVSLHEPVTQGYIGESSGEKLQVFYVTRKFQ